MEREETIQKIDSIKDRIEAIDKEREALLAELKETLPVKIGDKVSVMTRDGEKFVRFAFIDRIQVKLIGKDRKAKIEFDLIKCKADGTKSQHSDYLKYQEYITKIKS